MLYFSCKIIQYRELLPFRMQKLGSTLCKAYAFEPNMLITLDIRPKDEIEGNINISIDVQTPPVLPLCELLNHIY